MKPENSKYTQYAYDVIAGKIIACNYIKLACQRFLDFFDKYEFIEEKVDRVINFCLKLKHFTGQYNGKPFIFLPWQIWMTAAIFGFYHKDTNRRLVNSVYVEVARKLGKTAWVAAIQLYMLIADGENGAECDFLANNAKQAKIAYDMSSNFLGSIDTKGKYFKRYREQIKFDKTKSFIQVLSSEASNLDGFNAYSWVLDECHELKDSKLYDVMTSSQGMRENPLGIIITTAGFNKFGFCYPYRLTCTEILSGFKEDDSLFIAIYTLDEKDDWTDESVWIKSNPNLGITVLPDYIRNQINKAKLNPSLEVGIKTKNLNIWCDSAETWIPYDELLKCCGPVKKDMFEDETFCYLGVDLSSVSDLTALSVMIPYNEKYYFKTFYYLPQDTVYNSPNSQLYQEWQRLKFLNVTPGNVVDYDYILSDIKRISEYFLIHKIGYDTYNATLFAVNATSEGLPMEPYSQSLLNFNGPTKELERQIKLGNVIIDPNPITLWCFSNAVLKHDFNENCKPIKEQDNQKIDGTIAMIEALGVYLGQPVYSNEIETIT